MELGSNEGNNKPFRARSVPWNWRNEKKSRSPEWSWETLDTNISLLWIGQSSNCLKLRRRRLPMGHRLVRRSCFWQRWFATVPQSEWRFVEFESWRFGDFRRLPKVALLSPFKTSTKAWSVVYVSAILLYVCSKEIRTKCSTYQTENFRAFCHVEPPQDSRRSCSACTSNKWLRLDWQRK